MIRPISSNNLSFKKLYINNDEYYTDVQKDIVSDMKEKLEDRLYENYNAVPSGLNKIDLYRFYGLRKIGPGLNNDNHIYSDKKYIGTYDKENPLKIEDLNSLPKFNLGDTKLALFTVALLAGALAITAGKLGKNPPDVQPVKEKVVNVIDTVSKKVKPFVDKSLNPFK